MSLTHAFKASSRTVVLVSFSLASILAASCGKSGGGAGPSGGGSTPNNLTAGSLSTVKCDTGTYNACGTEDLSTGQTITTMTFTADTDAIDFTPPASTAEFTVKADACSPITAGTPCTLTITYNPTAPTFDPKTGQPAPKSVTLSYSYKDNQGTVFSNQPIVLNVFAKSLQNTASTPTLPTGTDLSQFAQMDFQTLDPKVGPVAKFAVDNKADGTFYSFLNKPDDFSATSIPHIRGYKTVTTASSESNVVLAKINGTVPGFDSYSLYDTTQTPADPLPTLNDKDGATMTSYAFLGSAIYGTDNNAYNVDYLSSSKATAVGISPLLQDLNEGAVFTAVDNGNAANPILSVLYSDGNYSEPTGILCSSIAAAAKPITFTCTSGRIPVLTLQGQLGTVTDYTLFNHIAADGLVFVSSNLGAGNVVIYGFQINQSAGAVSSVKPFFNAITVKTVGQTTPPLMTYDTNAKVLYAILPDAKAGNMDLVAINVNPADPKNVGSYKTQVIGAANLSKPIVLNQGKAVFVAADNGKVYGYKFSNNSWSNIFTSNDSSYVLHPGTTATQPALAAYDATANAIYVPAVVTNGSTKTNNVYSLNLKNMGW